MKKKIVVFMNEGKLSRDGRWWMGGEEVDIVMKILRCGIG
jgi:hypothetical protein